MGLPHRLLKKYAKYSFLLLLFVFVVSCSSGKAEKRQSAEIPVSVSVTSLKDVPFQIRAIGNAEAYNTVSVKPLVTGEIVKVYFKEGQFVNKGDMLFRIDPRPFEAALKQAEANLARDRAQAKKADEDIERYAFLIQKGYVSKQEHDQVRATGDALNATVQGDIAFVETNRLQLEYTAIRSPINGQVGNTLINVGNVVKANDVTLVDINQINPIYVTFTAPEVYLSEIKKYMSAGRLKIEATVPGSNQNPETGVLTSVDNAVDKATGTIKLKGTFENRNKRLWPGQFVNVVLNLYVQTDAVIVPSQAVQSGQTGPFVFVVRNDLTAEMRPVVVTRAYGSDSIIEKGLTPGEQVVTDGQLMLTSGARVQIKEGIKTETPQNAGSPEAPKSKESNS